MLSALGLSSSLAIADEPAEEQQQNSSGGFYFGWQTGSISESAASKNGIGDSAGTLYFGGESVTNGVLFGGGIGLVTFDDKSSFDVRVEDQYGNESTESANASGADFYIESGYRFTTLAENIDFDVLGGFSYITASRSVDNCSDCPSDDLSLDGGLYLKANMLFRMEDDWYIQLGYKALMSDDMGGGVNLAVGFGN